MAGASGVRASRLFVILNPAAGSYAGDVVRQALARHFSCDDGSCTIHETRGHENLAELAREAAKGCDIVVAAGGDGTVSGVADGVAGSESALGIIPLGTANVLARELGIPVELEAACALLSGPHATAGIDTMEVEGRHYLTQVGVGIDALMIRDTDHQSKRRFGRLAYIWTAATRLVGFQPRRFVLNVDGRETRTRASQVLVANCGTLGQPPLKWGPNIRPDDGRADICIIRARTLLDYAELSWHVLLGQQRRSRNVRYLLAEHSVVIDAHHRLPVQADGEIIGETPVSVRVAPKAIRVVVPEAGGRPTR